MFVPKDDQLLSLSQLPSFITGMFLTLLIVHEIQTVLKHLFPRESVSKTDLVLSTSVLVYRMTEFEDTIARK